MLAYVDFFLYFCRLICNARKYTYTYAYFKVRKTNIDRLNQKRRNPGCMASKRYCSIACL